MLPKEYTVRIFITDSLTICEDSPYILSFDSVSPLIKASWIACDRMISGTSPTAVKPVLHSKATAPIKLKSMFRIMRIK